MIVKIMWVCNIPIEPIAQDMGKPVPVSSGWIMGLYNEIIKNEKYDLVVTFPMPHAKTIIKGVVGKTKYYSFYRKTNIAGIPDSAGKNKLTRIHIREIMNEVKADILYVFGTEYSHSLIAIEEFAKYDRTIVNIQGLVSVCCKYYYADLSFRAIHKWAISNWLRGSIPTQKKKMYLRGINEINAIKKAGHIVGRTDWDRACTRQINRDAKYHLCRESLREGFYNPPRLWNYEECEKHSIFVTQATYPIKGFHYLLEALPTIIAYYPDTKVYVAGNAPVKGKRIKDRLAVSAYGLYLAERIRKLQLQKHIFFCGSLNQSEMIQYYLKANVFVLPSIIENSPNSLGEAMILRVPCVSADVGGVKSLVKHEEEALIYQHNETRMLADCIIRVFEQKEHIIEMAQKGYERALITHDRKQNCEDVLRVYDGIFSE